MSIATKSKYSPGILSLLPIFYVTWSDSVLSPSEIKIIRKRIQDLDFLTFSDKRQLVKWLNPAQPPSPEEFKEWIQELKKHAPEFDENEKLGLSEMGLKIAQSSIGYRQDEVWKSPKTQQALQEIEEALGIRSEISKTLLETKLQPGKSTSEISNKGSFDTTKMQAILDGEHGELINRVKKLLRDPAFSYEILRDKADQRKRVSEQVQYLADQGASTYAFPEKYGGKGAVAKSIAVFEAVSYHDQSLLIKFGVQFGLFGGAIYGLGTERHFEKYLNDMMTFKLPGCFAMTETGHGSNVRDLETTATYNHSTGLITVHSPVYDAGKEYIGNAMDSRMAAVFAQLIVNGKNEGVHALMVPLRDRHHNLLPGVKVLDCGYKMGLNGVDNGRIWFDQVTIPKENLLNKYGDIDEDGNYISPIENPAKRFFTMLGALVAGRVSVGIAGNTGAKSALSIAVKYALKRRQFSANDNEKETLIMDYPSHQKRLIPRIAKTYALNFALHNLQALYAKQYGTGEMREVETLAAGLKSYATWHCTDTVQEAREACGGKGYLQENRLTDLKADTDIFTTFEGDNTVLLQLVAKSLMSEFRDNFNDGGYMAIIRFLADRFSTSLTELNPITIRNTNAEHLLDKDFHISAFNYRVNKLTITVGQRMRNYLKRRITPYQAYLRCQIHMQEMAEAYVEKVILDSFYATIERTDDEGCRAALTKLCQLFALNTIQDHKGWYLENDYMTGSKTKALRRVVNKLIQELRPEVLNLVTAFNIPDELLGAKIVES
ncbi:acyl-CoA dehydrogenase family protein [Portibacter lacus]|uniref:acyl-CoA oxidase n=1 Tax=Portibacter lacus TaxID=1099794 RepID=A0AA37SRV3_9BACT|nr:acyl-CoA dehydrogenase [Portibacter lacus]GLR19142.1 acyl-CoA oxidase [Portibacter lacus]